MTWQTTGIFHDPFSRPRWGGVFRIAFFGVGLWPLVELMAWNVKSLTLSSLWKSCGLHPRVLISLSLLSLKRTIVAVCGVPFKVGFYLKAVFPSRNLGLIQISRSRFKQSKNCSFISRISVLRSFWIFDFFFFEFLNFFFFEFLGDFGGYLEEIVFLNGLVTFREIRNGEDLMWF